MNKTEIINAYVKIREIDNTIPDDVLNFMKESAIEKIEKYFMSDIVTAEEAYEITRNKGVDEELRAIMDLIKFQLESDSHSFNITIQSLKTETQKRLQELGYNVKHFNTRRGLKYEISWAPNIIG